MRTKIFIFAILCISCAEKTGTIDNPYHLGYEWANYGTLSFHEDEVIIYDFKSQPQYRLQIERQPKSFSFKDTDVTGTFVKVTERGCEGNPSGEYKEVVLYNLILHYETGETETTHPYVGGFCD